MAKKIEKEERFIPPEGVKKPEPESGKLNKAQLDHLKRMEEAEK
jgi:hypothetical protein